MGDEVEVATGQGTTELRVSGIVRVNGTDGAGPASLVVFDLATARKLQLSSRRELSRWAAARNLV